MVCQKKKGCAALNHKSYSRLCQISSTLQAPKRNKETLLFGFPFSEGDRKLKGAQINLKMRTKCGVVPGCQAVAQGGTRERPRSPSASRSCSRRPRAPSPSPLPTDRTEHDPRSPGRKPNSGGRSPGHAAAPRNGEEPAAPGPARAL